MTDFESQLKAHLDSWKAKENRSERIIKERGQAPDKWHACKKAAERRMRENQRKLDAMRKQQRIIKATGRSYAADFTENLNRRCNNRPRCS